MKRKTEDDVALALACGLVLLGKLAFVGVIIMMIAFAVRWAIGS